MTVQITIHESLLPPGVDAEDVINAIEVEETQPLDIEELRDVIRAVVFKLTAVGNAMNWPPELPMEYAHALNALRFALGATPLMPPGFETVLAPFVFQYTGWDDDQPGDD